MGNNQNKPAYAWIASDKNNPRSPGCDDQMCQNPDSNRSTAEGLVYVCPEARCEQGKCNCGPNCERDPYTGMCCRAVEVDANGNTFCIENPDPVSSMSMNYRSGSMVRASPRAKAIATNYSMNPCNIPDQKIGNTIVPGQRICDIYRQYNKF